MMSQLLDSAVFPGIQGGPLEHVIAAKAVAFGEILQPEWKEYAKQVKKNAAVLAQALIDRGFTIVSGGTDNHSMLVDLRSKYPDLTGKVAEKALVSADITVNKNMVPFDSRSAFQTSGIFHLQFFHLIPHFFCHILYIGRLGRNFFRVCSNR